MLEQAAESPSRHGIPAFQHDLMRLFSIQKSSQHDGPSTSAPPALHSSEPCESKPGTCHSSAFSILYVIIGVAWSVGIYHHRTTLWKLNGLRLAGVVVVCGGARVTVPFPNYKLGLWSSNSNGVCRGR